MSLKRSVAISVRDLVEYVLRSGDLGGDRDFVSPARALEGARAHRQIQKSRPTGYEAEVSVSHTVEDSDVRLTIRGRIDGVLTKPDGILIEEIKSHTEPWSGQADPLHWAQGKIYGFLYLQKQPFENIEIQLTYLDLRSEALTVFRQTFTSGALAEFFVEVTGAYLAWVREYLQWCDIRDQSLREARFPFANYRRGQRSLAVTAYRTLMNAGRTFLSAPTGIGKTISVLFPAIKALADGKVEKIFYLTAKTIGRMAAENALNDLRAGGMRLRAVTLTARDKICFAETRPCDVATCPFALGYFDRVPAALRQALTREVLDRPAIEEVARQHQVCPYALSLEIIRWTDLIICDYNYVFDPKVFLRRYFTEESGASALLVDEAHNLADRARDMFSADLDRAQLAEVKRAVQAEAPACARMLDRALRAWTALRRADPDAPEMDPDRSFACPEAPADLVRKLQDFLREAESWLARNQPASYREALLELYFRVTGFVRTADLYDERYVTLFESFGPQGRVRLFCLDPSLLLQKALRRGQGAVFFSATLTPLEYFREVLGGMPEDAALQLASPFPTDHLCVLVEDQIQTHLRGRSASYDQVADAIAAVVRARNGNYLVYFPSYEYLNRVHDRFRVLHPDLATLAQTPAMTEPKRAGFIGEFHPERPAPLVGFAVLGGLFGEGIDLVGDRLIGAIIVGVGLPQLCLERDLIRDYYQERNGQGFEYAYTYPGMNRVLQAAGRVIRSESDRGVILLIDARFGQSRYQSLFPNWWPTQTVRGAPEISAAVRRFWADST